MTRAIVWFRRDLSPQARDGAVQGRLSRSDIAVERSWSTLIHPPGTILTSAGRVPRVFTRFYERWATAPLPQPARAGRARITAIKRGSLPRIEGTPLVAPGSEAAARRLDAFLERVDIYDVERDLPGCDATSHLSADLRFGTISPRRLVRAVAGSTPGREAFVRQLAWRDWYAHLFAERPELVDHAQQPQYDTIAWRSDADEVQAWKHGRTGFPIVDAGMRELAATGWMPNRLRLVTASFFVKDLLADWRIGERHFRHLLVDGDIPQNAGNWQWVAGTGPDAAPYFRVLNPLTQARRFDPDGDYVRRFVPELAALPGASIHAPSELGPLELASAGVILGETYPYPIVDHSTARARALAVDADRQEDPTGFGRNPGAPVSLYALPGDGSPTDSVRGGEESLGVAVSQELGRARGLDGRARDLGFGPVKDAKDERSAPCSPLVPKPPSCNAADVEQAARYHLECVAVGGTEILEAEVIAGRAAYQKYFLPNMWEANLERLRRSDPDLFEGIN